MIVTVWYGRQSAALYPLYHGHAPIQKTAVFAVFSESAHEKCMRGCFRSVPGVCRGNRMAALRAVECVRARALSGGHEARDRTITHERFELAGGLSATAVRSRLSPAAHNAPIRRSFLSLSFLLHPSSTVYGSYRPPLPVRRRTLLLDRQVSSIAIRSAPRLLSVTVNLTRANVREI